MLALPEDIVSKDVGQWLDNGWFYANTDKDFGQPEIVCLQASQVDNDSKPKHAAVCNMHGVHSVVPWTKMYAHWPICGAVNVHPWADDPGTYHSKYAMSLIRLQKKQWKRTYNSYCLRAKPIVPEPVYAGSDHYPVIHAAFNPEYFSYTRIVDELFADGWVSCAITPNLIVLKGEKQRVFVDGDVVGLIDKQGYFTCVNPGLKRRLMPYFDGRVG